MGRINRGSRRRLGVLPAHFRECLAKDAERMIELLPRNDQGRLDADHIPVSASHAHDQSQFKTGIADSFSFDSGRREG